MFSRAFAEDALQAHRHGTPITVLDPANPAYDPKRATAASSTEGAAESPAAGYDEHVPVLIVGGGYAGLASSLLLSHHGVPSLLIDKHPPFSLQGRARGINWRTMEIYRSLGIADAVHEEGKPFDDNAGVARCTTLAGEWEWLYEAEEPRGLPEHTAAEFCLADQSSVEPVLMEAALGRGADQRFNTTLVSFQADDDGVTAVVEDRDSGQRRTVRADYLIAADGSRSMIREQLGIERPGPGVVKHWVSIVFEADLSQIVKRSALFWIILNPEFGFASMVTTATAGRWAVGFGYDPEKDSPDDFTARRCEQLVKAAVGLDDLEVTVLDVGSWEEAIGVADSYRGGRVFLAGDSAHVWPPAGGMGANSAIQDAHNLAWKLAAVIKGHADPSLLDSYEAERRPVARELAQLTVRRQESRFNNDEPYQDDVDDTICVLGQRYRSSAVLGAEHDSVFGKKLDLRARPGERAPHVWLDKDGTRLSVHDLCHDSFVLLTGSAGTPWTVAAEKVAERTSVPLRAHRVGPASAPVDLVDVDGEWQTRFGLDADGAVLLRPDGYVAWRASNSAADTETQLSEALNRVLHG
ncbi:MAG: FAD-dependent monooxygenase [Kutzneria sp.]|nr:FAD-dependent monooxygenase [Kutzneria sp.]